MLYTELFVVFPELQKDVTGGTAGLKNSTPPHLKKKNASQMLLILIHSVNMYIILFPKKFI